MFKAPKLKAPKVKAPVLLASAKHLSAPLVGIGVLMATYLLVRPYGDAAGGTSLQAAEAFASPRWVVAHLAGVLALASVGRLAMRLHDIEPSRLTRIARTTGLAGVVLVLPYYGAETFGLHAIGTAALAGDPGVLQLVDPVRGQPVAMTAFGIGLLLLGVSALASAWHWQRRHDSAAAWPLAVLVALVLPQFYLPPVGRMAFGVACLAAALAWLAELRRTAAADHRVMAAAPESPAAVSLR